MKLLKKYMEDVPKKWRAWGDTILVVGGIIVASTLAIKHDWIMATGLIAVVVGKILTNFPSKK